jgi:hypothetical protein
MIYEGANGSMYSNVDDIPDDMPILTAFPFHYVTKEGKGYSSSGKGDYRKLALHGDILYDVILLPLSPKALPNGKLCFVFRTNGKRKRKSVHVDVLETFLGPCPEGHSAYHLDGDIANNRLDNLAYRPNGRQISKEEQALKKV